MKRRILFVGDLDGLCNEFREHSAAAGSDWTSLSAGTSAESLKYADEQDFHAVVTDIQLPDSNGVDLLDAIMQRQPQAIRLLLSDMTNPTATLNCIGRAHRHVMKPCDAATLTHALNQAFALDTWLPGKTVQKFMTQMRWVPAAPSSISRFSRKCARPMRRWSGLER